MSSIRGKKDDKTKKSYAEEHDFKHISIAKLPRNLILAYKARQPLNIVGDSGIGKTEMVKQACKTLGEMYNDDNFGCLTFIVSQLCPEDIMGIPMPDKEQEYVKFLKMSRLPRSGRGILFLDEWNQADPSVLKPLFQMLGERRVGDWELPEGWAIIAACNPDGGVYRTTPPSPAFRRRMSHIEVHFDHAAFVKYTEQAGWNSTLREFLRRRPDMCYNKASEQANRVFANPASWERVDALISLLDPGDSFADLTPMGAGLVGWNYWKEFSTFFKKHGKLVDPKEVLTNYDKIRASVQALCKKGMVGQLSQICAALITYMVDIEPGTEDFKNYSNNVAKFYNDLLDDTAVMFIKEIDEVFSEKGLQEASRAWTMAFSTNQEALEKMIKLTSTYITANKERTKMEKQCE